VKPPYWDRAKRALAQSDPVMRKIIRRHPRTHVTSRGDAFQTLARSIVGQQISVRAAQSVWERVARVAAPVTAQAVCALDTETLRNCGLSARKTEYLGELARGFAEGRVRAHRWADLGDEEVVAELVQMRGIGRWTAEMFLIFNLMRPDVLPCADLGLQRAVSLAYRGGRPASEATIRSIARDWQPWRSVATWYLWRSLDPVPVEY